MRHYLSLALTVILAAMFALPAAVVAQDMSDVETVTASANRFAIDLYRQIGTEEENVFFSPYSIYTILALMYGGASGETAEEMAEALYVELEPERFHAAMAKIRGVLFEIQEKGEVELSIANSLWPQVGDTVKDDFMELAESYLVDVIPVDYRREPDAAREAINLWASELTSGRIPEIVDWSLDLE
ncbi:MAG: hypothetical protein KAU31_00125, partial [Spirochaetaceae bacterium]|nr:hypothetical protein [Spirochaetaceae bacterium]